MPRADQTNTHTRSHTHAHTHKAKENESILWKRETQTWFRSSSKRGSPWASSSVAVARSSSTQMRSMKSPWPTLSLSLSLFIFCFIWFWSCVLFYAMMWLIWFYCVYSLLTCLVAEKPLENIRNGMDWLLYFWVYFLGWFDLIFFFFFFMGRVGLNLGILILG